MLMPMLTLLLCIAQTKKEMDKIQQAKDVNLKTLLAELGYDFAFETPSIVAYKSMIPGRYENKPSFMIRKADNKWCDYGYDGGKPHDTIDFVRIYKGLAFREALDFLLGERTISRKPFIPPPPKTRPSVQIEEVREIKSAKVYDYINKRGISPHRARYILKEFIITFPYGKNPERKHLLVGHYNDSGGADLRNNFFKTISVAPKNITTIKGVADKRVSLFEGVFDYLSALEYFKTEKFRHRVIILNSTAFVGSVATFLKGKRVYCFSDNDPSGDMVFDVLKTEGALVSDERSYYKEFNDFNDKLKNK